jgi:hypothetical protein
MPALRGFRFTSLLRLAEKWARQAMNETERHLFDAPGGKKMPALVVNHAGFKILIFDHKPCVLLTGDVLIPKEMRAQLASAKIEDKQKGAFLLRMELMSGARTGWYFVPPTASSLDQIERFGSAQLIRISDYDPQSFTRFVDGIQEVSTVAVRALNVLGVKTPPFSDGEVWEIPLPRNWSSGRSTLSGPDPPREPRHPQWHPARALQGTPAGGA